MKIEICVSHIDSEKIHADLISKLKKSNLVDETGVIKQELNLTKVNFATKNGSSIIYTDANINEFSTMIVGEEIDDLLNNASRISDALSLGFWNRATITSNIEINGAVIVGEYARKIDLTPFRLIAYISSMLFMLMLYYNEILKGVTESLSATAIILSIDYFLKPYGIHFIVKRWNRK